MDTVIDEIPKLSIITQIELLCWKTDKSIETNLKSFIADSAVINISPEVINHCVKLRKGRKIKTPDAIIAATALAFNYTIITSNEKDFANIPNLKIVNPKSI